MKEKVILAFLQNQWFKDPERVQRIFDRNPDKKNDLIARYLFAGCLTGRRLQAAFGSHLCDRIIWENASPKMGDFASAKFEADLNHMRSAIAEHNPDFILCFGKIASDAIRQIDPKVLVLCGPHPALRQDPMSALRGMAAQVEAFLRPFASLDDMELIEKFKDEKSLEEAEHELRFRPWMLRK